MTFLQNLDVAAGHESWSGNQLKTLAQKSLDACRAEKDPNVLQGHWVKYCQYVGGNRGSCLNGLTFRGILGEGRSLSDGRNNSYMQARPDSLNKCLYGTTADLSPNKQARPAGLLNHVTSTVGLAAAEWGVSWYTGYAIFHSSFYAKLVVLCGSLGHGISIVALPVAVLGGAILGCMYFFDEENKGKYVSATAVAVAVVSAVVIGLSLLGVSLLSSYGVAPALLVLTSFVAGKLACYAADWVFDKVGYIAGGISLGAQILCVGAGFGLGYIVGQLTSPSSHPSNKSSSTEQAPA